MFFLLDMRTITR